MLREIFLANFNSIKVQLELVVLIMGCQDMANFNSIKVQLELSIFHIRLPYPCISIP